MSIRYRYIYKKYDDLGKKFIFSPKIMAEIIDAVYNEIDNPSELDDFERPDIEEKNKLNEIRVIYIDFGIIRDNATNQIKGKTIGKSRSY